MNFYNENAHLLFGSWLRRISDAYLHEVSRIYKSLSIQFEPSWFPIFFILSEQDRVCVTELAKLLEISQPAISQMTAVLQKKQYVDITPNEDDARKKDIVLSPKGRALLKRLLPVWKTMDQSISQIFKDDLRMSQLVTGLEAMEASISEGQIHDMIVMNLSSANFKVEEYPSEEGTQLYNYFLENEDVEFDYPEEGSEILVANTDGEIVGAIAFNFDGGDEFQLHNLYVKKNHRFKGIAKTMLKKAIPQGSKACIVMDRATPELVDLLLKCSYSFKVQLSTQDHE